MHVVATAGHVDHGKSALVRALTGMEPDRWAEERRRGMTLDLGFAWTEVGEHTLAFVDVPGHERFVATMLAGVGPVPAVLLVVSADEGWMPQTEEHVAALAALGVRHVVVAVSRADLADPVPVAADAAARLADRGVPPVAVVAVSSVTMAGLDELRAALESLGDLLPPPDLGAPVRLWVDRAFTIRGAGTVVTGTLPAGTLRTGDELEIGGARVRVRALQSLGSPAEEVVAVARVAVNLRGVEASRLHRGDALLSPDAFPTTATVDVRLGSEPATATASGLMLHVGSAAVPVHLRPLAEGTARLRLQRALPLVVGDRVLLRDPGRHHVVAGAVVLDAAPPPLTRRGAAARRGHQLASPERTEETKRQREQALRSRLHALVDEHARTHPLEPGPTVTALRRELALTPSDRLDQLVDAPLALHGGRIVDTSRPALPDAVRASIEDLHDELAAHPFLAPEAARLTALGLGPRELAAAERAGALLRLADNVVLLPGADVAAAERLRALPAPFTVSDARATLGTTRRVAVPLLELLDRRGLTRRGSDDRRIVATPPDD